MINRDAYKIIGKHVFVSWRTYADLNTMKIIIADNKEDATKKAKKYFGTSSVTVCSLCAITKENDIYDF